MFEFVVGHSAESKRATKRKRYLSEINDKRLYHVVTVILTWLLLDRLAFVPDEASINGRFEAERPPVSAGTPSGGWRCPWCSRYRRRKWTRWHEFKSWTRLIGFHIALIPLGKVWIQLFSLQLWVNSRTD